jgi:hypothetical protein
VSSQAAQPEEHRRPIGGGVDVTNDDRGAEDPGRR